MAEPLIETRQLGKEFAGISVLRGVDWDLLPGEVHVLAGENGAGKSTLIKILSGVHRPTAGEIFFNGDPVVFASPRDATARGISVIHQEMSLVDSMTVLDNLFLGREKKKTGWGVGYALDGRGEQREAEVLCKRYGFQFRMQDQVESLSLGQKNLLEILKALLIRSRVLIMDEPTSALNDPEVEQLFKIIADLKAAGCGIIYISHKMEEIYRIADRITVLRDGNKIGTARAAELSERELVAWMVGRPIEDRFPRRAPGFAVRAERRQPILAVENLGVRQADGKELLRQVSFELRPGEILGVAGLEGSGKTDLMNTLFGLYTKKDGYRVTGQVWVGAEPLRLEDPRRAIRRGVAYVTSDRKGKGLVLPLSVSHNLQLARVGLQRFWRMLRLRAEKKQSAQLVTRFDIRGVRHLKRQEVQTLSGGNQQKVVLAKWTRTEPRVFLLDDPTRGVDIGAKTEIYRWIYEQANAGVAVLLISSELPELIALSDRILVMHRGEATAVLEKEKITPEGVIHAAMGA